MPFHREKLSTPILRLEISDTSVTPLSTSPVDEPSLSFRERAQAALPSRRPSPGNVSNTTSPLSSLPPALPAPAPGISKARDESQKLLAHVLEQLRHRPKFPSSCLPPFQTAPSAKSIFPRPSASRTTSEVQSLDPENEEISERTFSPDLAFDLMNRLRDVLMISLSRGWQIFSERYEFWKTNLAPCLIFTPPAARPQLSLEGAKSRKSRLRLPPSVDEGAAQALIRGACHLIKLNQWSCFPSAFPFSTP